MLGFIPHDSFSFSVVTSIPDDSFLFFSGDMDFAADIADFKRRMFLSVILLHRFNDQISPLQQAGDLKNSNREYKTKLSFAVPMPPNR